MNAATQQILVQAYSFTSAPIAKALVDVHKREVKVLAVLDKANETDKYSAATFLVNAGIQTLIDDKHAIAHNKVMVIDSTTVITGSFNFTKAAEERNAENLLVIKEAPELVQAYTQTSWRMQPTRTPIRGQLLRHLVLHPQHLIAMARCMGTATVKCTGCQAARDTLA